MVVSDGDKSIGKGTDSPPPPHNLPSPPTPLVGREHEITAASHLLQREEVRLLTLTGPPGIGKTRLAIEVANMLLTKFAHGVYFVDLAPITDSDLVLPTVAYALGLRQVMDRLLIQELKEDLSDKRVLLVLDNFEQVIQAAPALSEVLQATHHLKILVTSRELLHISAEYNFPVPPLSLPPVLADLGAPRTLASLPPERLGDYDAVQLFVQRAGALQPDFALTPDNALFVAGICSRLDGLPLAIELAAARVRHIPPQAIYGRLEKRLHVLTGGARDLPMRQRTLRTAIEWSYNLLESSERLLFARLAVFRGGCSLAAVEAVCGDALSMEVFDGLASLVDKSLVQRKETSDGEARFALLEMIHEYAREQLEDNGEFETVRRQHATYFVSLAERAEPELRLAQQKLWLRRLEDEHDNLRAALRWALKNGETEIAGRLGAALWRFWERHSHLSEGRQWLEQILATGTRVPASLRAQVLAGSGFLAFLQGDYTVGRSLEAESLRLYQALGDKVGIALSFTFLADMEYVLGDPDPAMAITRFEQALVLSREAGDKRGIAKALSDLGEAARTIGDYPTARARYEESLAIRREVGDSGTIAIDLHNLGHVARHEGDYEQARQLFTESLLISNDLGNRHTVSDALRGLAGVAAREGQPRRAARLFGAAEAVLSSFAGRSIPVDWSDHEGNLAAALTQLDEETWEKLWAEGQEMTLDQVIAYAQTTSDSDMAPPSPSRSQLDNVSQHAGDLTRGEREVAYLIAEGKSNREIAAALVITERTVEGHVSNILSKLSFRSRGQVSVWVVENMPLDR